MQWLPPPGAEAPPPPHPGSGALAPHCAAQDSGALPTLGELSPDDARAGPEASPAHAQAAEGRAGPGRAARLSRVAPALARPIPLPGDAASGRGATATPQPAASRLRARLLTLAARSPPERPVRRRARTAPDPEGVPACRKSRPAGTRSRQRGGGRSWRASIRRSSGFLNLRGSYLQTAKAKGFYR